MTAEQLFLVPNCRQRAQNVCTHFEQNLHYFEAAPIVLDKPPTRESNQIVDGCTATFAVEKSGVNFSGGV
jgi:hypothetical protein